MTTINNAMNYNDLASLNSITKMGQTDEAQALKKVAQQFESMFVTMMLKSMRDANSVFEEDNPLNSNESKFYRQMFDDQLALSLTEGKGIGLSDSIYRQLKSQFKVEGGDDFQKPDRAFPINQNQAPNPFSTLKPAMDFQHSTHQPIEPLNHTLKKVSKQDVQQLDVTTQASISDQLKTLRAEKPETVTANIPVQSQPSVKEAAAVQAKAVNNVVPIKSVSKQTGFETPEQFVETIWPIAQKVGKEMGVEPKAIISQAALETGWGKYIIHESNGKNSHNLFGIKSDQRWNGSDAKVSTLEYRNGVAQKEIAAFRSYDSYEHSLKDYANFVKTSSRYQDAVKQGDSIKGYSEGLQSGGYATDPQYAKKIQRIANGDMLNSLIGRG